jgi:hypothetical protein
LQHRKGSSHCILERLLVGPGWDRSKLLEDADKVGEHTLDASLGCEHLLYRASRAMCAKLLHLRLE